MPSGVRANSLLVVGTPSVLVRSLDEAVEYLDRDGVPRRRVRSVDARRLVLRGSSLSSLDTVRAIYDQQELDQANDDDDQHQDDNEDEDDNATNQGDDVYSSSKRLDEKLALERVRQAKMLRRQHMICELRDRKRTLLLAQHENILERVQLWNDALALDPEAELTSAHTAQSPSSKAHAFVDEDGNVRRKSIVETEASASDQNTPATAASVFASIVGAVAMSPRRSFVLEFMQILLED